MVAQVADQVEQAGLAAGQQLVEGVLGGVPGHLPAHERAVPGAFGVGALAQDGEGDVAGVQVGQFGDLGGDPGAAFALLGGGMAVPPHEVVGDQLAASFERVEQGDRPGGPVSGRPGSTSVMGSRRRAAAIASPSRVCAFSRTRSWSSSAWKAARPTPGHPWRADGGRRRPAGAC